MQLVRVVQSRVKSLKRTNAMNTRSTAGSGIGPRDEGVGAATMPRHLRNAAPAIMERRQVYHSDPEILSGTPVFTGTRVPIQNLVDYLAAGDGLDEFLADFPTVSREQVQAFLTHAKEALLASDPA